MIYPVDVVLGGVLGFSTMFLIECAIYAHNKKARYRVKLHDDRLGRMCAEYRKQIGVTQSEVAREVGCSRSNISAFEHGRTDSALIFLWYIKAGCFGWRPMSAWGKNGKA